MQKTILYAVLNWGLGHATRSIPIIKYLVAQKYHVVLCSDGDSLALLKKEFPSLTIESLPSYNVKYSENKSLFFVNMVKQIPQFIYAIEKEQKQCIKLCKKYDVDYILSDNRYGFYHDEIPSAFICHQLTLRYPKSVFFENIVNTSYQRFLENFTEIWVPDFSTSSKLSGEMSSSKLRNVKFIGVDSRFKKIDRQKSIDTLTILSGPEPQRSILETKIYQQLERLAGNHVMIRGTEMPAQISSAVHIRVLNLVESALMNTLLCSAKMVICRSGYTSIMDLIALQQKAVLIPTPGQPEQEYLAQVVKEKKWFFSVNQEHMILSEAIERATYYMPPKHEIQYDYKAISIFLDA